MKNSLRNVAGAVRMGLFWAAGLMPVGPLIGLIVDPQESMDEPWGVVGAFPGFLCGVVFFALLRIAEGRRRLHELSVPRVVAWGALSGLLVPLLFVLLVAMGLGTWRGGRTPWPLVSLATGASILGSACAAAVSLPVARWWRRRTSEASAVPVHTWDQRDE